MCSFVTQMKNIIIISAMSGNNSNLAKTNPFDVTLTKKNYKRFLVSTIITNF